MQWIDTHVHLFSTKDSDNSSMPLLAAKEELNTSDNYLEVLGDNKPEGIVVVDFSKSKDSEHVINSLDDLKKLGINAAGIIKGNLADSRTKEWIMRDDVKGIRLYAKDAVPNISGEEWQEIFEILRTNNKHILVFGASDLLPGLINQIPEDIVTVIDHLGLPKIFTDEKDEGFATILRLAADRGNVYFKGPGYRTSLDVEKVKPVVQQIADEVGIDKLMIGASDGPFAGPVLDPDPQYEGKKFSEVIDYQKVIQFTEELAKTISNDDPEKVLFENANKLYF